MKAIRKVALITGGATGIGAATARLLAQRSYNVVINYSRSLAEARETEIACRALGADTLTIQGDIRSDEVCRSLAQSTVDQLGRLDALINCAGTTTFSNDWEHLNVEEFQRIYSVNAVAAFQMARACAPHLQKTSGTIVNVSSAAGVVGRGSSVPYIMSKGALNSLTLYLARTLAPQIRVNAVCPGLVTSNWFRNGIGEERYQDVKHSFEMNAPLGRASEPEDIAKAVVWMIEDANTMTGELLLLDSGRHLG